MRIPVLLARLASLALLIPLAPLPAAAFEFADGRVQVHGFAEVQLRSIARDLDPSDDWDLTQWYNVLNIEIEADLAPDGWGPFDLLSAFARVEARYDCVWTRGCGIFSSADTYGDRAHRLPQRLADGRRAGFRSSGTLFNGDTRRFAGIPRERLGFEFGVPPLGPSGGPRIASRFWNIEGIDTLFDTAGVDEVFGSPDDPAPFVFDEVLRNCRFGFRKIKGRENGVGTQVLGPWNPQCKIDSIARIADKPHPLSATDPNEVVLGPGGAGFGALPFRPVPRFPADPDALRAFPERWTDDQARGIYMPNHRLAQMLRDGEFDHPDQTFRQAELEWNRGASQQDEKELKELYLDMEFLDSRLWVRAGKQTIVWGKTELFRTTDQFNPQDLALASLPSLEESRIALWAVRGVWAFYSVGPLEDVRLELAANLDQFEPNDLGRCGEPYSPLPVCDKTFGLFIHGLTGLAAAGEVRPPNPWNSWKGLEFGARLEFRWDRFSMAITDFYGYEDLPYQERLFTYARNVDPLTGRPRFGMSGFGCDPGPDGVTGTVDDGDTSGCLVAGTTGPRNALQFHSANQQLFAMICATSVGLSPDLDPTACGQSVFNSRNVVVPGVRVANLASNLVAGNPDAHLIAQVGLTFGVPIPRIPLVRDPCDGFLADCVTPGPRPVPALNINGPTLNQLLTVQQQALLGCGQFYSSDCERDGIDLMNAEATSIFQSFPGIEGAGGSDWDTTDPLLAQPGTFAFRPGAGPVCTRFVGGSLLLLPGCRSPGRDGVAGGGDDSVGYDVNVDGSLPGRHPFFDPASPFFRTLSPLDQRFASEMAGVSFNALMALVALSSPDVDPGPDGFPDTPDDIVVPTVAQFDPSDPYRAGACSFSRPFLCSNVQSLYQVTGLQRNTLRAGGNGRFGRRDFVWHGGTPLVLRYERRNVLGFSMDFAEDVTKSNWGVEFTWIEGLPVTDFDELDRTSEANNFNLTVSVDRPTFINFLNQNRTLFFNSQWFMQYIDNYRKGFSGNGPWNVLATFTIQTGFFRDRFLPNMTFVYDFGSNSAGWLPSVQYRYTENFSVTFGLALFSGRMEDRRMAISPTSMANRVGRHAYRDFVENGLSVVRERDEAFLRVRYTF